MARRLAMSRRPCRRGLALLASSRRLRLAEREDLVLWVSEEVWEDVESGLVMIEDNGTHIS
jgi:hypothetical protein